MHYLEEFIIPCISKSTCCTLVLGKLLQNLVVQKMSLIKFDIVFSSLESSENALLHQSQAFCTMFLLSKLHGCALKLYGAGDVKKIAKPP